MYTCNITIMKKLFVSFSFILIVQLGFSQDTIRVQAFDYNSQTRDTVKHFPDNADTYRQIIMKYNMRCKEARISTGTNRNLGCGEWDYSCNTYIEDPTRTDSLNATTNEYVIDGFSGTTYNYKEAAINNFYRSTNITTTVNSFNNLDSAQLGTGTISTTQGIPVIF